MRFRFQSFFYADAVESFCIPRIRPMTRTGKTVLNLCFLVVTAAPAMAQDIEVPLDHVTTVTLTRPAKTIYIGNPAIADVTVIDPKHVFVLGKTFGSTNLVALDASGQEVSDQQVLVTARPGSAVTVLRGIARTTMMCNTGGCEIAPTPGDDATSDKKQVFAAPPHDALLDQVEKRESLSQRAASGK